MLRLDCYFYDSIGTKIFFNIKERKKKSKPKIWKASIKFKILMSIKI